MLSQCNYEYTDEMVHLPSFVNYLVDNTLLIRHLQLSLGDTHGLVSNQVSDHHYPLLLPV